MRGHILAAAAQLQQIAPEGAFAESRAATPIHCDTTMKASSFPIRHRRPTTRIVTSATFARPGAGQQRILQADEALGPRADDVDRVPVIFLEELDGQLVGGRREVGEAGDVDPLGLEAGQDRPRAVGRRHDQRLSLRRPPR